MQGHDLQNSCVLEGLSAGKARMCSGKSHSLPGPLLCAWTSLSCRRPRGYKSGKGWQPPHHLPSPTAKLPCWGWKNRTEIALNFLVIRGNLVTVYFKLMASRARFLFVSCWHPFPSSKAKIVHKWHVECNAILGASEGITDHLDNP